MRGQPPQVNEPYAYHVTRRLLTLGRYTLARSNFGRGQLTSRSPMDLKVILDAT